VTYNIKSYHQSDGKQLHWGCGCIGDSHNPVRHSICWRLFEVCVVADDTLGFVDAGLMEAAWGEDRAASTASLPATGNR